MPAKYYKRKKSGGTEPVQASPISGTGQWAPGALSAADTRTTTQSVAEKISTPFVDLGGGKTGTVVNRVEPLIAMSDKFAAKASSAGASVSAPPNANIKGSIATPGVALPEMKFSQQNLMPPVGAPTPQGALMSNMPVDNVQEMASLGQIPEPPTSIFGAGVDAAATKVVNWGLDFVSMLGNGDFGRGLASIITLPLTAGSTMTASKNAAGIVSKESTAAGGLKSTNTIKNWFGKLFTQEKLIEYVNPATGKSRSVIQRTSANIPTKAIMAFGGALAIGAWLIKDAFSGKAVGTRDVKEEAGGMMLMAARDMMKDGNQDAYWAFSDMARKAMNDTVTAMPLGGSVMEGSKKFAEYGSFYLDVMDEHMNTSAKVQSAGVSPDEQAKFWIAYHAQIEADKTAAEKERVDYYNSERLRVEQQIAAARSKSNDANMQATAAFWLEYHKKIAAMEEEERKKQAEFWKEYRKLMIKMQEETRSSSLRFGLFR